MGERQKVLTRFKEDAVLLEIDEGAKQKIGAVLDSQEVASRAIRVSAPFRGKYSMSLEPDGEPLAEDVVLDYDLFKVFVDRQSQGFVNGANLRWVDTAAGGGFQFENPNDTPQQPAKKQPPDGPEGDEWRTIQQIIDEQVNPSVAGHGGHIDLFEYRDGIAYVQMGGGCQGCGQAKVTLKQGVERLLRELAPGLKEVLDITDHADGRNPYYAP